MLAHKSSKLLRKCLPMLVFLAWIRFVFISLKQPQMNFRYVLVKWQRNLSNWTQNLSKIIWRHVGTQLYVRSNLECILDILIGQSVPVRHASVHMWSCVWLKLLPSTLSSIRYLKSSLLLYSPKSLMDLEKNLLDFLVPSKSFLKAEDCKLELNYLHLENARHFTIPQDRNSCLMNAYNYYHLLQEKVTRHPVDLFPITI